MATLRRLTPADLAQVRQWWRARWAGEMVVVHGAVIHPDPLDGFVAVDEGNWVGLITYYIEAEDCEIVSLDSLKENQGIGTALVRAVIEAARQAGCRRVHLVTTNDNLTALKFYQKLGFALAVIHRNAMDAVRRLKPEVPMIGEHGIPLRDEIELELKLTS
jgi:ribosomal protein S18 acetylase RimI-like enzyme